MRYFVVVDRRKIQKNCRKPRARNPVARRNPLGVPFISDGFVQHLSTY